MKSERVFKIGGPWDGKTKKKPFYLICQVTLSSYQISEEVQKPCCRRGPGWLSFVDECPKYIFFSAAESEQILSGGWASSCAPGDKKAQNGSSVGLHAVPQRLQNVIRKKTKNKKGMPVTEILNICSRYRNKHLLEISCKNKFWSKIIMHEIRGTNFRDTL